MQSYGRAIVWLCAVKQGSDQRGGGTSQSTGSGGEGSSNKLLWTTSPLRVLAVAFEEASTLDYSKPQFVLLQVGKIKTLKKARVIDIWLIKHSFDTPSLLVKAWQSFLCLSVCTSVRIINHKRAKAQYCKAILVK